MGQGRRHPEDTCGVRIRSCKRLTARPGARAGCTTRATRENYKGAIRVKHDGKVLAVRAYIGTEMLGETEEMTRTDTVPSGCKAH